MSQLSSVSCVIGLARTERARVAHVITHVHERDKMFETLYDMFMNGLLALAIFSVLAIRLAMKKPKAAGSIAKGLLGVLFRK